MVCFVEWSTAEANESSTYRELKIVLYMLLEYKTYLENKKVKWNLDSQPAVYNLIRGSMNPKLHNLAGKIRQIACRYKIRIFPNWLPRTENTRADFLSKAFDSDSWTVNDNIFGYYNNLWGPYECDRFTTSCNTKCPSYNTKSYEPESSGVNAFNFNWHGTNNWLVPPVSLICDAIKHAQKCDAHGTIIVPKWQTASYWPLVVKDNGTYKPFIKDYVEYIRPKQFFLPSNKKCMFKDNFPSNVLLLMFDFNY